MELTLFVDHACNLRCSYCYNGQSFARPMSDETMQKAVELALSTKPDALDVSFFGGEPLLRRDFLERTVEYVEQRVKSLAHPPNVRFILNTNGTLLDGRNIDWMKAPRNTAAFVSLDGPSSLHDQHRKDCRGRGTFSQVVAGVEHLHKSRIPVHLVSVINPDTADQLGDTVREALPLRPKKITLSPNFRAEWSPESIEKLSDGLADASAVWAEHFRSGAALPIEPLHTKILTHLYGGIPCPVRCQLGGSEFAVAPSGRIYPCAQMIGEDQNHDVVIGHVDTGIDPAKTWQLQRQKDGVEKTCESCAMKDRCQSHCGCRHLALTGRLGDINALLCEVESALVTAADAVADLLYQERCQSFMDLYYRRRWEARDQGRLLHLRRSRSG